MCQEFKERLTAQNIRAVLLRTIALVLVNIAWLLVLSFVRRETLLIEHLISPVAFSILYGIIGEARRQKIIQTPKEGIVVGIFGAFVFFFSILGMTTMIDSDGFKDWTEAFTLLGESIIMAIILGIFLGGLEGLGASEKDQAPKDTSIVPILIFVLVIVTIVVFFIQQA